MSLYESGTYEEAEELFAALTDYKDSADMVLACRHAHAVALMDGGELSAAADIFYAQWMPGYQLEAWIAEKGPKTCALQTEDDKVVLSLEREYICCGAHPGFC